MNQHLSQEELILAYYGETTSTHLETCESCQAELGRLAAVLDRVTLVDVPEPGDDYEARVWNRLEWRLRGEKKRERNGWMKWAAIAAVIVIAFAGGLLWNRRTTPETPHVIATNTAPSNPMPSNPGATNTDSEPSTAATASSNPDVIQVAAHVPPQQQTPRQPQTARPQDAPRDRILLLVVGEHMDQSERMLVELTNLTPSENDGFDIKTERAKAEELLASNRLYRRTALDRGEENVATLLNELEPMLMQIAHAPDEMTADELRTIQKRVETKGLVFKLRVVRADVSRKTVKQANEPTT
ncbi:MAG TPA: hypothetical protein VHW00_07380 [Thermoanaerobaculia bacterium]|nr:hypothetical protein [Thermoanaerobaculia bacterium]